METKKTMMMHNGTTRNPTIGICAKLVLVVLFSSNSSSDTDGARGRGGGGGGGGAGGRGDGDVGAPAPGGGGSVAVVGWVVVLVVGGVIGSFDAPPFEFSEGYRTPIGAAAL